MNKVVEWTALSIGGLCLFAVSFLGFALSAGVPLKKVAVIGPMFEASEPEGELVEAVEELAPPESIDPAVSEPPEADVIQRNAEFLSLWSVPAPFEASELESLATRIKAKEDDLERRLRALEERETDFSERAEDLTDQFATLETLRAEMMDLDRELRLREKEVASDDAAKAERERTGWADTARLFNEGEAEETARRLTKFKPTEAAKILRAMDETRALELLKAIPEELWKEYFDAYRAEI